MTKGIASYTILNKQGANLPPELGRADAGDNPADCKRVLKQCRHFFSPKPAAVAEAAEYDPAHQVIRVIDRDKCYLIARPDTVQNSKLKKPHRRSENYF